MRTVFIALTAAVLAAEVLSLTSIAPPPHEMAWRFFVDAEPFLGPALLAALVPLLRLRPGRLTLATAIVIGHGADAAIAAWRHAAGQDWPTVVSNAGAGFGVAAIATIAVVARRASPDRRPAATTALIQAVIPPLAVAAGRFALDLSAALRPRTFDPFLAAADRVVAGDLVSLPARLALASPLVETVAAAALLSLPLVWSLLQGRRRGAPDLATAFGVAGAGSFLLYLVLPAAGPAYAFPADFPLPPPAPARLSDALVTPAWRDAFLSLPFAWALLVWWEAASLGRVASALGAVFALAVGFAGLAFGHQYLTSLVAAIPLAAAARAVARRLTGAAAVAAPVVGDHPLARRVTAVVALLFFLSGFAGLVYEVVFAKQLAITFGSTAVASTTVLATYMGGMALGAWLGGRLAPRRTDPLRAYALCELGVGLACAFSPLTFAAVRSAYVAIASGTDPSAPHLVALQVALGGAALLPPTVLMGLTLPLLTRHLEARDPSLGRAVGLLYGANTLGAAAGALLTGYVVLPALGVLKTTLAAVCANFAVAGTGIWLQGRALPVPPPCKDSGPTGPDEAVPAADRHAGIAGIVVLTAGGAVTMALETVYIHLLAVVAGTSAYAFSLMLFAFLIGLGLGAAAARRLLRRPERATVLLAVAQAGIAATVLAGVFLWDRIPAYFGQFASYGLARGFGEREFVRGLVCCLAMIPPALFIGASYPAAMECVGRANPGARVAALGRAAALNTVGNIAGALAGGFLLVPALGSLTSLHLLAAVAAGLSLVAISTAGGRRLKAAIPLAAVAILFAVQPGSFDYTRLASGTNVYFSAQGYGTVIDHAESLDGGLTTVAESSRGSRVLTLLTNGKFQGDDSPEMGAQAGFALVPLLHTDRRGPALNIGFGTGVTARVIHAAGFAPVDVVDLSADILAMADRYFSRANDRVLHRPEVRTFVTDGRNFLLLGEDRYDLISIELTSIWFAGAASLYNREFYRLVKDRLEPGGVLQQWIQLHRLSTRDIASVIATLRSEFRQVWLYFIATQGVLIACDADCPPSADAAARLGSEEGVRSLLPLVGGVEGLRSGLLLSPVDVDRFLAATGEPLDDLLSTDDNLYLEYSTPRGNIREWWPSLQENLAALRAFRSPGRYHEGE